MTPPYHEGPQNVLLIGNPGTGKSTILNGLIGKPIFKSGVSYGRGLTYQFDKYEVGGVTYMDTPGLADEQLRHAAAKAITKALQQDGYYKIFFVVTLQNGRVNAQDVATMRLVLNAAPITDFGIIINQVAKKQFEDLTQNPRGEAPSPFERVLASFVSCMSAGKTSLRVELVPRLDELECVSDAVMALPERLRTFMDTTPGIVIGKERVTEVKSSEYQAMQERYEAELQEMHKSQESLREKMDQLGLDSHEKQKLIEKLLEQQRQMKDMSPGTQDLLPVAIVLMHAARLIFGQP